MATPTKAGEAGAAQLSKTQELAVQVQGGETAAALAKATTWLGTLAKTRGFKLEQRYLSVDLVDTATRQHQQHIVEDYLALPRTRRAQEKALWETAHGFWAALSAAYLDCIAAAERDDAPPAKVVSKFPVLAARGVRAAAMQIKWILFRYGLVEPWLWTNLARCLQFAEKREIADVPVALYLSTPHRLSTNQMFLRAIMLAASDTEGLSVPEQEIASRWIEHLTEYFKLDRRATDDVTLYFDLDHALPPRRIVGTPLKAAHRRFFGAMDALPEIQRNLDRAREAGTVAPSFALPKGSDIKQVVRVLDHLAVHWAKPMPAREWERRATTTCLEIKHDYRSVLAVLEQSEQGKPRLSETSRNEFWIVDNAGRGGYSAIVPRGQRAWLHVGVLIAIRLEYQDFWSLAVIRRVETDERHQRKVGIRVIARKPVAALLRTMSRVVTDSKGANETPGILLNTRPSRDRGVHVLMRPDLFTPQQDIDVLFGSGRAQSMSLKPSKVMESTSDYVWVRYEVKP